MAPHLRGILDSSLRWVFVGGKGGVGKTTCSCSLAVQLAASRESVLIISTDPAHNLSDAFRQKFSRNPTLVDGFSNLYALEIDPTPEVDLGAEDANSDSFLADLAGSIPGIDEAMSFAAILKQVQALSFSVVVFDTAPTGHTLRLLQLPTVLEKTLQKLMGHSGLGSLFSSLSSMLGGGQSEDGQSLFAKLEGLQELVGSVNAQFKDASLCTFVCVAAPEWYSLYETERLVQTLAQQDIDVHNVVINGVLYPEAGASCGLCAARTRMQKRYLAQFDDLYSDFNVVKCPLLPDEVRGPDQLREFSKLLVTPYVPPNQED